MNQSTRFIILGSVLFIGFGITVLLLVLRLDQEPSASQTQTLQPSPTIPPPPTAETEQNTATTETSWQINDDISTDYLNGSVEAVSVPETIAQMEGYPSENDPYQWFEVGTYETGPYQGGTRYLALDPKLAQFHIVVVNETDDQINTQIVIDADSLSDLRSLYPRMSLNQIIEPFSEADTRFESLPSNHPRLIPISEGWVLLRVAPALTNMRNGLPARGDPQSTLIDIASNDQYHELESNTKGLRFYENLSDDDITTTLLDGLDEGAIDTEKEWISDENIVYVEDETGLVYLYRLLWDELESLKEYLDQVNTSALQEGPLTINDSDLFPSFAFHSDNIDGYNGALFSFYGSTLYQDSYAVGEDDRVAVLEGITDDDLVPIGTYRNHMLYGFAETDIPLYQYFYRSLNKARMWKIPDLESGKTGFGEHIDQEIVEENFSYALFQEKHGLIVVKDPWGRFLLLHQVEYLPQILPLAG